MIVKGGEIAKIYQLYISDNDRKYNNGNGYLFTNQDIYKEQIQNLEFATTKGFKEEYKSLVKRSLYKQMGARIEFSITRRKFGGYSEATIKIYNINRQVREVFAQDLYDKGSYFELRRQIYLLAGHKTDVGTGSGLGLLFNGRTFTIRNYKQGIDVITEIYARGGEWRIDGEKPKLMMNLNQYNAVSQKELMMTLTDKLYKSDGIKTDWDLKVKEGVIDYKMVDSLKDEKYKSNIIVQSNNIFSVIKKYAPNGFIPFIDNQQFYLLKSTQIITNEIFNTLANSDVMLETPKRNYNNLTVKTILMPFVQIAQQIQLSSQITSKYNGFPFEVMTIVHSGTINDAGESKASTQLELRMNTNINYKTEEVKKLEEKAAKSLFNVLSGFPK